MPEVKSVAVSVGSPSPSDPQGRATVGYYVLQGDVLTMTDVEGVAVRRRSGEIIKQTLQTGDDPHVIAQRLTLSIYRMARGDGIDFNRPLNYPNIGVV